MKKSVRFLALSATAAIGFASLVMFAGCTTKYPEITITYEFLDVEYEVEYQLNRNAAPMTVQHFIELADAGYYDGTVIHSYESSAFLYGGAYVLDENGELVEKDYLSELKKLEETMDEPFTQSVYVNETDEPIYTLRGEFPANGMQRNSSSLTHTQGALAMYYTDKGQDTTRVRTTRADGGEGNGGVPYQDNSEYKYNCTTSQFYTFIGEGTRSDLDKTNVVFGMTLDYETQLRPLVLAINDYRASLTVAEDDEDGDAFIEIRSFAANQYDYFESVRNGKIPVEYKVPVSPIVIKSVKVDKY